MDSHSFSSCRRRARARTRFSSLKKALLSSITVAKRMRSFLYFFRHDLRGSWGVGAARAEPLESVTGSEALDSAPAAAEGGLGRDMFDGGSAKGGMMGRKKWAMDMYG